MLKIESGNNYFIPTKGNHSVHILPNVPIYNHKPLLSHIKSYTKFEENCADRRDGYGGVLLGIKNDLIYETLETRDDVEAVYAKIPLDKNKTLRPTRVVELRLLFSRWRKKGCTNKSKFFEN